MIRQISSREQIGVICREFRKTTGGAAPFKYLKTYVIGLPNVEDIE